MFDFLVIDKICFGSRILILMADLDIKLVNYSDIHIHYSKRFCCKSITEYVNILGSCKKGEPLIIMFYISQNVS